MLRMTMPKQVMLCATLLFLPAFTSNSGPVNCKSCSSFPCITGGHIAYLDATGTKGGVEHFECWPGGGEDCPHGECNVALLNGHTWHDVLEQFARAAAGEAGAVEGMVASFPRLVYYDPGRGALTIRSCTGTGVAGHLPVPPAQGALARSGSLSGGRGVGK